jgi:hypothetical protein
VGSRTRRVQRDLRTHERERLAEQEAAYVPGSAVVGWCDGGEWAACFGLSLHNLFMHDFTQSGRIMRDPDKRYYLRDLAGSMGIASARNNITRAFLDETDAEWLFMVDSDMGFEADTVDRLIASAQAGGYEVMGALAFALKRRLLRPNPLNVEITRLCPTLYQLVETEAETGFAPMFDYPHDQVVQVGGTGAACMVVHRGVMSRIRAMYGDRWFEPITHPTGDHGRPRAFSEDFSFCVRVAGVGGRIGVDTAVKTGHAKGGIFLTEEQYVIQRAVDEGLKVAQAEADIVNPSIETPGEQSSGDDWRTDNPALIVHSRQNGKTAAMPDPATYMKARAA